jgi:outer membrane receptor protein involved in Fe transport
MIKFIGDDATMKFNNINLRFVCISLLASSCFIPVQAMAQNASPDSDNGVQDIIVTAQKRAQSINDVGLTITALGTETLQKQGVQSLADLARVVPGLSFANTDFGTPVFTLRGVGYYDNSLSGYPTTSVYVDEVPLPFAVMSAHANLDVQRIEVLKGPQGTLFGQNSTGGAINYIANKPTDSLAAGVDATLGRFGAGEANAYVSGPITEHLGVRLSGQYGYGSPWQRSYTRNDSVGQKDYLNGRILAGWQATPSLKIQLNVNGWRDRSDPPATQLVAVLPQFTAPDGSSLVDPAFAAYPFAPRNPRAADWNPAHRPKGDRYQYQGSLRGDLDVADNVVLTSISSYTKFHTDQQLDPDGTSVDIYEFNVRGGIKSFTQELRLAGGDGTRLHWVLGGNYENSRTFENQVQSYHAATIGKVFGAMSAAVDGRTKKENYAFFANGEYEVTPGLTVKAGGRYTHSRQRMNECNYDTGDGTTNATIALIYGGFHPGTPLNLVPGDCYTLDANFEPSRFFGSLTEHNFSWRGGIDYKPSRDLLFYVNVAKGYKAGAYVTSGGLFASSYKPVRQESLLDYEAGFKAQLLDRRLSVTGAGFWYDYRNKQLLTRVIDPIVGLIPALANVPTSRVRGAELEVTALPVEGLQLSGGLTYLDAKITKYEGVNAGGVVANFAGTPIPFTSKWQYIASADYTLPTSGRFRPFVGATLTGRSSTTSIVGSAVGTAQLAGFRTLVPISEVYNIPAYTLLDLRAGIESEDGGWRLTVWGRNITNKYYIQNVVASFEATSRYVGQPATYGVTFNYKFQ